MNSIKIHIANAFKQLRLTCIGGLLALMHLPGCAPKSLLLLYSPDDPKHSDEVRWVRSIREKKGELVVVDQRGHRQMMAVSSVWGYQDSYQNTFRLYDYDQYEVVQKGPLMVYRTEDWGRDVVWENYYFSITPFGDIFDLDRQTVRKVFRKDACMQRLLSQMRERHLLRTDSYGSYGLANAYSHCHCQGIAK